MVQILSYQIDDNFSIPKTPKEMNIDSKCDNIEVFREKIAKIHNVEKVRILLHYRLC